MPSVKNVTIKLKRKTTKTNWSSRTDTLAFGEPTLVTETSNDFLAISNADNTQTANANGVKLAPRAVAPNALYSNSGKVATYSGSTATNLDVVYNSSGTLKDKNGSNIAVILPSDATATTQSAGDNSTKIATTAFVQTAISGFSSTIYQVGTTAPTNTNIFWVDTSVTGTAILKYYDSTSTSWKPINTTWA